MGRRTTDSDVMSATSTPAQQQPSRRRQTNNSVSAATASGNSQEELAGMFTALPTDTAELGRKGFVESGSQRSRRATSKRSMPQDFDEDWDQQKSQESSQNNDGENGNEDEDELEDKDGNESGEDSVNTNSSPQKKPPRRVSRVRRSRVMENQNDDDKDDEQQQDGEGDEEEEDQDEEDMGSSSQETVDEDGRKNGEGTKKRRGRRPNPENNEFDYKKVISLKDAFPTPDNEDPDPEEVKRCSDKCDADGNLLDQNLEYLCHAFRIPSRHPRRLYGLCSDVSKQLGFKTTFWFLANKRTVRRLEADNEELTEVSRLTAPGIIVPQTKHRGANIVMLFDVFAAYGDAITIRKGAPRPNMQQFGKSKAKSMLQQETANFLTTAHVSMIPELNQMPGYKRAFYEMQIPPPRPLLNTYLRTAGVDLGAILPPETDYLESVAKSAADFNARLRVQRQRRPPFMEVHTARQGVPQATQPTTILVHSAGQEFALTNNNKGAAAQIYNSKTQIDFEPLSVVERRQKAQGQYNSKSWTGFRAEQDKVSMSSKSAYPLAIFPYQYQDTLPIYSERFIPSQVLAQQK